MDIKYAQTQNPLQYSLYKTIEEIENQESSDDDDDNEDITDLVVDQKKYPSFDAKIETYSIQQLYTFLEDIFTISEERRLTDNEIIDELNKIIEKALKINTLQVEFKKWLKDFLSQTSGLFLINPKIVSTLASLFMIVFPDNNDANNALISLMETSIECCTMAIKIFSFYIKEELKLNPFDTFIRKIFCFLENMDLRPLCISVIKESLTNSHYLFESLSKSNEELLFLSTADDPISILNGLEICKQMIDAPQQKFPNDTYNFFFAEIIKAIFFFANEEIMNDIIILRLIEISNQLKSIELFYFMEPNDILYNWLSSIFLISERYFDQGETINSDLSDCLNIITNLIKFWLLPPNLLRIQDNPDFMKWKEDFVSLCLNFFLQQSHIKRSKIAKEIMENPSFCKYLGRFFSTVPEFKNIVHDQLKNQPRNVGNSVLISIFASVLKEREFVSDIRPFLRKDLHTLHYIVKYYFRIPFEKPENIDQFLFSDAHSRLLFSFSSSYLQKGRVFMTDKIMQDISNLYIRTLVNLQANDESENRLSRGIEAVLSVPFDIVKKLIETAEIVPVISELKFDFIQRFDYKDRVEDLFDHLFSIHDEQLDQSLLSNIDLSDSIKISRNSFVIVRSFFKNCIDEDHERAVEIVKPIIHQSLEAQIFLDEVSKTIKVMSEKAFHKKSQSLSLGTVEYVKIIIDFVHLLLEQFVSPLPNEEIIISQNVLKIFTNLLEVQPINFGYMAYYGDLCFQEIIDDFFGILFSKDDISFFCNDLDFARLFITFVESFINSELENANMFNCISNIFMNFFRLHEIDQCFLATMSEIILYLIENNYNIDDLLPNAMVFKISAEPKLSIFTKMLISLCKAQFDGFLSMINSKENFLSEDANELLQYICSELSSENFEYSSQFEDDFNDCIEMIKHILNITLLKDADESEEEEDIPLDDL